MGFLGLFHLGPIPSNESSPADRVMCRLPQLEKPLTGGDLRKPDVVEIARRKVGFWDPTGWTSHRTDA